MKKWIKNFLMKPFGFGAGLYLYYSFFVWGEFYPLWYSKGLGAFLAFFSMGFILFGLIYGVFPFIYRKFWGNEEIKKQPQ